MQPPHLRGVEPGAAYVVVGTIGDRRGSGITAGKTLQRIEEAFVVAVSG
jgi:hypothetical protein